MTFPKAHPVVLGTVTTPAGLRCLARKNLPAHAIEKPATPAQIARWVGQFDPLPSTILKIAARIKSWHDLQQLAALLMNHPDWPLAVMGLGPYAGQSRAVLTALGSRLIYGYL